MRNVEATDLILMSKAAPNCRAFENLVGRIQRELAPSAVVAENERKRHQRTINVGYVSAFADQARDVSASRSVLISNTGFTKGAQAAARIHDVVLQTLREAEATDWTGLFAPGRGLLSSA